MLSFEDVFILPESEIQEILRFAGQPPRSFVVDRYVATVTLANNNRITADDYQCATNPLFQELYLNESLLQRGNIAGFQSIRNNLGCRSALTSIDVYCDANGIRQAIDRYQRSLYYRNVAALSQEFGANAFNVQYMKHLNRYLASLGYDDEQNRLLSIISFASNYNILRTQMGDGPLFRYLDCLLRILRSSPELADVLNF